MIPSREYSDILFKILYEENYFLNLVEENREKLKGVAYRKIIVIFRWSELRIEWNSVNL